mmetsp:Transcript_14682/g.33715  ORF Transcript_14682/g.33715 Transcript_14682/m.33715 type:complete len:86 (+) Transcript_14682:167-424(+)
MWRRKEAELGKSDLSELAITDSLPWEGSMRFLSAPQAVTSLDSSSGCRMFEQVESLTFESDGGLPRRCLLCKDMAKKKSSYQRRS